MSAADEPAARTSDWEGAHARLERARRAFDGTVEPTAEEVDHLLRQRARLLAAPPPAPASSPGDAVDVLVFAAGNQRYAVEVRHLLEVWDPGELVAVPQTPEFVLGVVNVRGRILTVIDVAAFLDPAGGPVSTATRLVVLVAAGVTCAVAADAVEGLEALVVSAPTSGAADRSEFVSGVSADLVALLEFEAIVTNVRFAVDTGV